MKRLVATCLGLFLLTQSASAARLAGFSSEAFRQAMGEQKARDVLFSPFSFEMDCVIVAESLDTIPKANVSETMGATVGFESVFAPARAVYDCRTNGYDFVAARGFCVPDLKKSNAAHRQFLQRDYGTEVMTIRPRLGAEAWFRAAIDGVMEDFSLPPESASLDRFSFVDLVSFVCSFERPFPRERTALRAFVGADGKRRLLPFMNDVRRAFVWENVRGYVLLKLPLLGGFDFLAFLPREAGNLQPIKDDLSVLEIDNVLTISKALSVPGVSVGPVAVSLPRLALCGKTDLLPLTRYFRIPTAGLHKVAGDLPAGAFVQKSRFVLTEGETAAEPGEPEEPVIAARELVFDRPFVFLVYHEETRTFPMAGVFSGTED